ncbi:hypothetical protein PC117_g17078 [Phytophthora cactorum]|uniref:Uncharacterized protein n=1 Tax=Phytophthora cactorum TaxID=29920 RepID=A0A8T1C774_9STRA|nr:hypothetical protein PC117_g17078 [Phytophthora cactorum]
MDCRLLPCLKMWKTARIAECVADKGKKEFCRCRDHLEELERMARENEHPLLCTSPPDDATADIDSKIDVTSEIGDVGEEVTNLCGDTNTKRPVEATPEMNNTTESVSSAKGKLGTIPSPKRKLEMDEQEKAVPRAPKARSRSTKTLVQLNPASRASGRPKLTASFKKAKKAKDIEETMVFVDDIATIGDVTLENFEDTVKKKRPKAFVIANKPAQVLETDVRFMLPDHSIPMPRGDKLDPKKLQYVRH